MKLLKINLKNIPCTYLHKYKEQLKTLHDAKFYFMAEV